MELLNVSTHVLSHERGDGPQLGKGRAQDGGVTVYGPHSVQPNAIEIHKSAADSVVRETEDKGAALDHLLRIQSHEPQSPDLGPEGVRRDPEDLGEQFDHSGGINVQIVGKHPMSSNMSS